MEIAKQYQEKMEKIRIPPAHEAPIPFATWKELKKSMSQKYGQPLRYATHRILEDWDKSRVGTEEDNKPMDTIIPSNKAEAIIWGIEEIHRRCHSHLRLAKLWLSHPLADVK
ncbi:hypothetical protein Ddye_011524, partial [Dipteronia dyeriana]